MYNLGMERITLQEAIEKGYLKKGSKPSKYKNIRTQYGGFTYDSKKEAAYAQFLDLSKRASDPKFKVSKFERQVRYPIEIRGIKVCTYVLDFKVFFEDGHIEHIDVKGVKTDVYRIKKKLMKALHGFDIIEK